MYTSFTALDDLTPGFGYWLFTVNTGHSVLSGAPAALVIRQCIDEELLVNLLCPIDLIRHLLLDLACYGSLLSCTIRSEGFLPSDSYPLINGVAVQPAHP